MKIKKIIIASAKTPPGDKGILHRSDIKIFHVSSGEEALNVHRDQNADLIIMDIDIPVISADKLCAMIREDEELKQVSLLVLCSNSASDIQRCKDSRANAHLTRPLDPVQFEEKVSQLLSIAERRAYRILIKIQVTGKIKDNSFYCSSQDLSTAGILLETDKPLSNGDIINCSFYLPKSGQIISQGEVMRAARKTVRTFQYGVRFLSMKPEHKSIIETFVKNWRADKGL